MKKIITILLCIFLFTGCLNTVKNQGEIKINNVINETIETLQTPEIRETPTESSLSYTILNKEESTIEGRYSPPEGFTRIEVAEDSFGKFLRNQKLKPYGEKSLYYDGRSKYSEGVYDSVIDVDIGTRDLHQCADAIMLLRAEYLYGHERFDQIKFNFVGGFLAEYQKWVDGYRIQVDGNDAKWIALAEYSTSYESFRKYMDMVFAYSGTLSLEKELTPVGIEDMEIGDVFIRGGSPGHAIIVVDMAQNSLTGEKVFMLAQSYMPAQQTQILINKNNEIISPWYLIDTEAELLTPEWKFKQTELKRFL